METFVFKATIDGLRRPSRALICSEFMFILFDFPDAVCLDCLQALWLVISSRNAFVEISFGLFTSGIYLCLLSGDPSEY